MNAPAKATLFTLVDAYLVALSRIDAETGEVDAETDAVLSELSPRIEDKLEACAAVIARLEAEEAACKEMAASYAAKTKARGNEVARIKRYVLEQMQRAQLQRVKGAVHTVWLQPSKSVEVDEGAELPERFVRVKPEEREPDKKALKAALDAGEKIDGARLVTDEHVRYA